MAHDTSLHSTEHIESEVEVEYHSHSTHLIPKTFHFIWLGGSLPVQYEYFIDSWKTWNKDWEVRIWFDRDVSTFEPFQNREYFLCAENKGMQSDILRYEILYCYGGVYVDVDYECVQSIESCLKFCPQCHFFAGESNSVSATEIELNNGIIGSTPGNPLLRRIIESVANNCKLCLSKGLSNLSSTIPSSSSRSTNTLEFAMSFLESEETKQLKLLIKGSKAMDTIRATGPLMLTAALQQYLGSSMLIPLEVCSNSVIIFPKPVFHPVPNSVRVIFEIDSESDSPGWKALEPIRAEYVQETTIAIHWWQRSWQA